LTYIQAQELVDQLQSSWKLIGAHHLAKSYLFLNFAQTMQAANKVAAVAEAAGHHPDFFISFKQLDLIIYTHKISGLAEADFILAAKIEKMMQEWDQAGRA